MFWAPWTGDEHFLGVLLLLLECSGKPCSLWVISCHVPMQDAGMPTPMPWKSMGTMASADPTAALGSEKGFLGLESPVVGEAGVCAGCGLAAGLGWEGKRPGAGSDVLHARR